MTKTIKKQIGNQTYSFNVEADSKLELAYKEQRLGFKDINKCGCCNSSNLELNDNPLNSICNQLFIVCKDCWSKLHLKEDPYIKDVLIIKGDWTK